MKNRALQVGGLGVHALLADLQSAAEPERRGRFHLIGHSFGGIVCSSSLQGEPDAAPLRYPIHALILLQGALSLWSFAPAIPDIDNSGFFSGATMAGCAIPAARFSFFQGVATQHEGSPYQQVL